MVQERRKAATQRCYHVPSSVPLQSHGTQLTHPMSKLLQATIGQMNLLVIAKTGLEITAGQRTMSGLIVDLTGQTFVLPVMLTGQSSIVLKMKSI